MQSQTQSNSCVSEGGSAEHGDQNELGCFMKRQVPGPTLDHGTMEIGAEEA